MSRFIILFRGANISIVQDGKGGLTSNIRLVACDVLDRSMNYHSSSRCSIAQFWWDTHRSTGSITPSIPPDWIVRSDQT